jgi:hypothetical protein
MKTNAFETTTMNLRMNVETISVNMPYPIMDDEYKENMKQESKTFIDALKNLTPNTT